VYDSHTHKGKLKIEKKNKKQLGKKAGTKFLPIEEEQLLRCEPQGDTELMIVLTK